MLAYRNGQLCVIFNDFGGNSQSIPLKMELLKGNPGEKDSFLKRIENELHKYTDQIATRSFWNISEIDIEPLPLPNYPNVKHLWQVRELFVRVFDQLGFTILRSDETFPEFVLLFGGIPFNATVAVKASELANSDGLLADCDLVICWENDLDEIPVEFEILEISKYYDFLST